MPNFWHRAYDFNVLIIDNCPQRKKGKIVHDQGASNISVFASVREFVFALIQSVSALSNFFLLLIKKSQSSKKQ